MANNSGGGAHDDYLNAPETAGRPMAITSLLLVFLLVAGVALALFVSGRWLYDQYLKDDKQTVVQEDSSQTGSQNNGDSAQSGQGPSDGSTNSSAGGSNDSATSNNGSASDNASANTNSNTSNGTNSTSTPQNNGSTAGSGSASGSGGTSGTATNNNSGEQSAIAGSVTGPVPEQVPNTGAEHVVAIFIATTILATLAHRRWLLSKQ